VRHGGNAGRLQACTGRDQVPWLYWRFAPP